MARNPTVSLLLGKHEIGIAVGAGLVTSSAVLSVCGWHDWKQALHVCQMADGTSVMTEEDSVAVATLGKVFVVTVVKLVCVLMNGVHLVCVW